jgi:methyl-accepting chemotaxis protein
MDKVVQQNAANAEESASASEELNSQAFAMRDIVGELVQVVGGNGDTSAKSMMSQRIAGHLLDHGKAPGKPIQLPGTRKTGAGEVRPDQVIPFDESEFREF